LYCRLAEPASAPVQTHHVVGYAKDWNRRRRLLCGANRDIPGAKDDIGFRFDQLHCNGWKLLGAQSIATPINRKISTLDEPKPAQFMTKRDIMWRVAGAEG
jgi:hypothetical protein